MGGLRGKGYDEDLRTADFEKTERGVAVDGKTADSRMARLRHTLSLFISSARRFSGRFGLFLFIALPGRNVYNYMRAPRRGRRRPLFWSIAVVQNTHGYFDCPTTRPIFDMCHG